MKNTTSSVRVLALVAGMVLCLADSLAQLPSWLPPHTDASGKTLDPVAYPHPSAYFTGVTAIAFNREGTEVAVGASTSISMISVDSGMPRTSWNAHKGLLYSLAFTSDGTLVSAGGDGTVRYWDASTGKEKRQPTTLNAFVALGPDAKHFAMSDAGQGGSGDVQVKEVASGKKVRSMKVEKPPKGWMAITINRRELSFIQGGYSAGASALAISPDGRILATAGSTVQLWDLTTGKAAGVLRASSDALAAIAFSPDGSLVAAGGLDHVIKIFEAGTGKELRTLSGHKNVVNAIAFSPDGRRLATGSWDNTIKIWEVETGREMLTVGMKWMWEVKRASLVECLPKPSNGQSNAPASVDECKVLVTVRNNTQSTAWMPSKHYKVFLYLPPAQHVDVRDIGWKGERQMVKTQNVTYAAVATGEEADFLMKFDVPQAANRKQLSLVLLDAAPVAVTTPE